MADNEYTLRRRENLAAWKESYPQNIIRRCDPASYSLVRGIAASEGCKSPTFTIAGRLVLFRSMGKLSFGQIQQGSDRIQFSLERDRIGEDFYRFVVKRLDLGDIIAVTGEAYATKAGEPTLRASDLALMTKALRPLPDKVEGIRDPELLARQRYRELASNPDAFRVFEIRSGIISIIRSSLSDSRFAAIETPILQGVASGAAARPFKTRHNALDIDLYLRIAPEIALKMAMAAGYQAVYEIGKNFRNEGMDSSHLQEFTMCEFYRAYWTWEDALPFTENLINCVVSNVNKGETVVKYGDLALPFVRYDVLAGSPVRMGLMRFDYRNLLIRHADIDIEQCWSLEALRDQVLAVGHDLGDLNHYASFGSLCDALFKATVRPRLINPCWVVRYPRELAPLAASCPDDPRYVEKFQMVVNGWEIVNGYTELVDPDLQRQRLEEQMALLSKGEREAVQLDEDFLLAMEHGMPPMAGVGIGIDRLVALLTNSPSVRDVVLFPNVRLRNG